MGSNDTTNYPNAMGIVNGAILSLITEDNSGTQHTLKAAALLLGAIDYADAGGDTAAISGLLSGDIDPVTYVKSHDTVDGGEYTATPVNGL